jgi:hypothetical protein
VNSYSSRPSSGWQIHLLSHVTLVGCNVDLGDDWDLG